MKLEINGKETDLNGDLNVSGLLVEHKVEMPEMVSVELNGQIVRRNKFDDTVLKEGDKVEFLYFMGGGRGAN